MTLNIQLATMKTKHQFAEILTEASAWQKARGSEGWSYPFDDTWMIPRIERGELFLADLGREPVAALRILWEDQAYWGSKEVGDSVYLHTFAVKRNMAGLGIGGRIIEQLALIGRRHGRSKMRLDCSLSSERLISYYHRYGFRSVGTVFMHCKMMNLMERDIADVVRGETTHLG